jgi:hypothetical protein
MLNDDYDLLPSSPRLPTQSLQSGSQSMWQAAFFSVVVMQPCRHLTAQERIINYQLSQNCVEVFFYRQHSVRTRMYQKTKMKKYGTVYE